MSKAAKCLTIMLATAFLFSCTFSKRLSETHASSQSATTVKRKPSPGRFLPDSLRFHPLPAPDTFGYAAEQPKAGGTTRSEPTESVRTRMDQLWHNESRYTTFSGNAKMKYEGPDEKHEFTAHFRIKKDSVIWIYITAFGNLASVARIYITPDSFLLVNFLKKEYMRMPLSEAARVLPSAVDFASLQNLVIGNPLRRKGTITESADSAHTWQFQTHDSIYAQQLTYNKTDTTLVSDELAYDNGIGPRAIVELSDYDVANGVKIATNRNVHVQKDNEVYRLHMNFTSYKFNEPLDFPFSIPASYTPK
jgi:Domain of unknown function (DUF4292)